jgi:hypothetical protein
MKQNNSGDFCLLYIEPDDEKTALFHVIASQQKPIIIILMEHTRLFQRPDDYAALKHAKRQVGVSIAFVTMHREHLAQLASRYGFPAYTSMDALADAISKGRLGRQRILNRTTRPLREMSPSPVHPRRTMPLLPLEEVAEQPTMPLPPPVAPPKPKVSAALPKISASPGPNRASSRPLVTGPVAAKRPARKRLSTALIMLVLIALLLAGLGGVLVLSRTSLSATTGLAGHVSFLSSGQVSENSSQGIDDQVVIDLDAVPPPAPSKSYYAWLLADKNQTDMRTVALGTLPVVDGHAHLFYKGDAQHTNLLLITSRFLVTEEDAAMPPVAPSPDPSTWCYYGEFAQIVPKGQPYSYLDHLRHLLAADPTLEQLGLSGGLNNWFYQNTSKIWEWTSSTREQWEETKDTAFLRRQTIRTLTYLDGLSFVHQDLPPQTPMLVNERLASVGLLPIGGPNQEPVSYVTHITRHLNGLLQSGQTTPALRTQVGDIMTALGNVQFWLAQVRQDALHIMKMNDQQLLQPDTLTIINDMIDNATYAYAGQVDPNTGQMHQGVSWIHTNMQELATLNIGTVNTSNPPAVQMIPDTQHTRAALNLPLFILNFQEIYGYTKWSN